MDTLVTPQLIFLNAEAANTLNFSSGYWLNEQVYRASYSVIDMNVTLNGITVSIQQARDAEGITNVPAVGAPFRIDTQNPTGVATIIGAESVLNELSVSTNAEVDLFIDFNEAMNQDIAPLITILGVDANAGLTLSAQSDWTSPTTYRAVFTLADTDAEIMAGDIEVSGAEDAAGNAQLITMLNDVISIDTRAPQGEVATSVNMVTDAEAGLTLTISVTCDSPMNTTSNPVLVFNGITESENFQFTDGQWIDSNTFEFTYAILDGNIQTNAQIVIAGSTDENGNLLNTTSNNDVIAIDTQNPTLTAVTPSVVVLSDDDVATGLTIDLVFSEAMNTMMIPQVAFTADNPLAATLTENTGTNAWLDDATYRLSYSATDAGEELNAINIAVTGVTDSNGNNQSAEFQESNILRVDTRNPLVVSMTPSTNAIATSKIGEGTFSIDLEFDEDMDQSSEPAISFSSTPPINFITNNSSQWNSATDYTSVYDIPNETLQIDAVDIALAFGAVDLAGNTADVFSVSNAFSIDVTNGIKENEGSTTWSIYPNPILIGHDLRVNVPEESGNARITIFDGQGKMITDMSFMGSNNPIIVNTAAWSEGMYMVRLVSERSQSSMPVSVVR